MYFFKLSRVVDHNFSILWSTLWRQGF